MTDCNCCVFFSQPECNTPLCGYDNRDCSNDAWIHCAERGGVICKHVFNDSKCDPQCNSEACLFDGGDCDRKPGNCNPHYDQYCFNNYGNGICNPGQSQLSALKYEMFLLHDRTT